MQEHIPPDIENNVNIFFTKMETALVTINTPIAINTSFNFVNWVCVINLISSFILAISVDITNWIEIMNNIFNIVYNIFEIFEAWYDCDNKRMIVLYWSGCFAKTKKCPIIAKEMKKKRVIKK